MDAGRWCWPLNKLGGGVGRFGLIEWSLPRIAARSKNEQAEREARYAELRSTGSIGCRVSVSIPEDESGQSAHLVGQAS